MARIEAKEELLRFGEAKAVRQPLEDDMRMAIAYCLPGHYRSWNTFGPPSQSSGADVKRFAYDATGAKSVPKFVALMNRLATPEQMRWHTLRASDDRLMRSYNVRTFFEALTDKLFKMRYNPFAGFQVAAGETYQQLGVVGTGPVSLTWRKPNALDPKGGFRYKSWSLKNVYILTDDNNVVVAIYRRFWLNPRQFKTKFGEKCATRSMDAALKMPSLNEQDYHEFVHVLKIRGDDYDPDAYDVRRHTISESYINVKDSEYCDEEKGYQGWPLWCPRLTTVPDSPYGWSAAARAIPALGGVNATKKTVLKQGQKAVEPPLLAADDGVLSGRVDQRPGKTVYGGLNMQGVALVKPMENGSNFQVAEQLLTDDRADIEDAFLVTIFKALLENPDMTATQTMQIVADQAAQLAPAMGLLQTEFLAMSIQREIALLVEHGQMPEPPQELIEAKGEYEVVYASPLAKGQYAEEVSAFMRWYEMLQNAAAIIAQAGGTELPTDWANLDVAAPEIADAMAVRTRWVNDPTKVTNIRKSRGDAQRESELIKQAPAAASIVNSAAKNGSQIQGVSNG